MLEVGYCYPKITKVNRNINFSCIQMFFTAFVLCILRTLRLFKLKTEGQTTQTENLTVKFKTQIKILAYPGLA